ncbi:MAG: hypothetical protein EKK46_13960 [Rhodocyclaceae bacterium]|nr:MAG: hypothetical protein EKK46_13960 [Rhodocyclaceae bacterium]
MDEGVCKLAPPLIRGGREGFRVSPLLIRRLAAYSSSRFFIMRLMTSPSRGQPLAKILFQAAADYQAETVIPHCPTCAKPCCKLDALVLEMDWRELKAIWQLKESRKAFDQRLAAGQGPEEIRPANGLYYAHQKVCPAYDQVQGSCRVYNQPAKPPGCSDFPVYENEGELMVDLRCEAVSLDGLMASITRAVGAGYRLVKTEDEQFPFLVTVKLERRKGQ